MRLLDLFCGSGGAAMGYHRAGFDVVGVDVEPQPHYPFEFIRADALTFSLSGFDAVHASPPCQAYSALRSVTGDRGHPDLISQVRERLTASGVPWVIENVPGAPLHNSVLFCGPAYGLVTVRHRFFESNVMLLSRGCWHVHGGVKTGMYIPFAGKSDLRLREGKFRAAIGCEWMTQREARQAIPPAYTEAIGRQLLDHLAYKELT